MQPKTKEFERKFIDKTSELFLTLIGIVVDPVFRYFRQKEKIRRKIVNDVSVSLDWLEISLQSPLKATKNLQAILIHIEGCWREQYGKEYKLLDGTIVTPEIEIFSEEGERFHLRSKMCLAECLPDLTWKVEEIGFGGFPQNDKEFTKIRIRSDIPFQCSMSWYDFNLK